MTEIPEAETITRSAGGRTALSTAGRMVLAAAGVTVLILVARELGASVPAFARRVDGLGMWGPLVFIVGYALAALLFVPGSWLTLAAGAIFGLVEGIAYVLVGATAGASAAFLVSRHVARRAIEPRLARHPKFAAIDRAVAAQGLKIVLLLRLSPIFPFNLLNYALGLTNVRFRDYLIACAGMLPGTVLYVYYGKLAGDLAALAGGATVQRDAGYYVVLVLGLIATIAVTTIVTRAARRAVREAADI